MATKKPLATISFNTDGFLLSVLEVLVQEGLLSSYFAIRHFGEEDTKKDHYHVFVNPAQPLEPSKLRKRFFEPVFNGDKPLGCLPFFPSKFPDWLLYSLHNLDYLVKKGLQRLNHYQLQDVQTNEPEYLYQAYHDALESVADKRMKLFLSYVRRGDSFGAILRTGIVPPSQIVYWEKVYRLSACQHIDGEYPLDF